jgi:8-oxo-dGTP pyrophosphatase MutT (NUDIX family)
MAMSPYLKQLRAMVGNQLLVMPSATAIIFDADRRLLLVEDISTGYWTPPGGSIEPHEVPADAVVREVREELGVTVEPITILGVFGGPEFVVEYHNGDSVAYVTILFECRILSGELQADREEVAQFRFVHLDEAVDLHLAPWVRHVVGHLAAGRPGALFDPPSTIAP